MFIFLLVYVNYSNVLRIVTHLDFASGLGGPASSFVIIRRLSLIIHQGNTMNPRSNVSKRLVHKYFDSNLMQVLEAGLLNRPFNLRRMSYNPTSFLCVD